MANTGRRWIVFTAAGAVALLVYLIIVILGLLYEDKRLPDGTALSLWDRCGWSLEKINTERAGGNWKIRAELGQDCSLLKLLEESAEGREVALEDAGEEEYLKNPGLYRLNYFLGGKEVLSWLTVEDSEGPRLSLTDRSISYGERLRAEDFVLEIWDAGEYSFAFTEEPDWEKLGSQELHFLAVDDFGNESRGSAGLEIVDTRDHTPPEIRGAMDRTLTVGDTVLYKDGVSAWDEVDGEVRFTVDSGKVNPLEPGEYPVIYTARDAAGNEASLTVTFRFEKKEEPTIPETLPEETEEAPEDPGEQDEPRETSAGKKQEEPVYTGRTVNGLQVDRYNLDQLTRSVYNSIITNGMSNREKAVAIWEWTRGNIGYVDIHHGGTWQDGAIYAFVMRRGSCYMFFAAAKALLQMAGIPQRDVLKREVAGRSMHYWQLVWVDGAWYHLDSTPRKGDGGFGAHPFCLWTDRQMLEYAEKNYDCFDFILTDYPWTPGEIPDRFLKPYYPDWFDENGNRKVDPLGRKAGTPGYDPNAVPSETQSGDISGDDGPVDDEPDDDWPDEGNDENGEPDNTVEDGNGDEGDGPLDD